MLGFCVLSSQNLCNYLIYTIYHKVFTKTETSGQDQLIIVFPDFFLSDLRGLHHYNKLPKANSISRDQKLELFMPHWFHMFIQIHHVAIINP